VAVSPAVFDRHVAAFDVAGFGKAAAQPFDGVRAGVGRTGMEDSHHRQRWLLRARVERAKQR
jgi:hypothetical protein